MFEIWSKTWTAVLSRLYSCKQIPNQIMESHFYTWPEWRSYGSIKSGKCYSVMKIFQIVHFFHFWQLWNIDLTFVIRSNFQVMYFLDSYARCTLEFVLDFFFNLLGTCLNYMQHRITFTMQPAFGKYFPDIFQSNYKIKFNYIIFELFHVTPNHILLLRYIFSIKLFSFIDFYK